MRSDDLAASQAVVEKLSQQVLQLTAEVSAIKSQLKTCQTSVMFYARSSKSAFNIAASGTVVYDTLTTNVGNAYDPQTGFFTAPASGDYVFLVNCMAEDGTEETVDIVVDGNVAAVCYSNKTQHQASESGTAMAALRLLSGQRVWVKNYYNAAQNIASGFWNTFAGFLVHASP
nr:hypothetical protein BaRGS_024475 [Batillaria attramentaria]